MGYLAHVYTASGLILVVLSAHFAVIGQFDLAVIALIGCVVIDATDGMLARRLRVKESAPGIDGRRLDDIVDFLSFVFVPMLIALQADLFVQPELLTVTVVALASLFGFGRVDAKQDERGFFVGFPSYWNVVIGYFWLFETPQVFNTVLVYALAVLVLVPVRFLYPSRLPIRADRLRHMALGSTWGTVCVTALLLPDGALRRTVAALSLAYPAYYTFDSVRQDIRDRRTPDTVGVPVVET